jgi:uncharacterized membrane protein
MLPTDIFSYLLALRRRPNPRLALVDVYLVLGIIVVLVPLAIWFVPEKRADLAVNLVFALATSSIAVRAYFFPRPALEAQSPPVHRRVSSLLLFSAGGVLCLVGCPTLVFAAYNLGHTMGRGLFAAAVALIVYGIAVVRTGGRLRRSAA